MSTALTQRLENDLKSAMRGGDALRRDVIRYVRASVKNQEIELRRPLTDDESVDVIQAQIKQRRDSIAAFSDAGRSDLATKEEAELSILLEYLPDDLRPIDEQALRELVVQKADELGLSEPSDMRALMPALIAATQGRADNRMLNKLAADELRRRAGR